MALTYQSYLRLDELLALQTPRSEGPEHDEMLFIVIHQVYELWVKQLLHETDYLQRMLAANSTPTVLATLERILTILKTLVAQIDVLETMTPLSFSSFRDRLDSSSGFQSAQFRELEFRLGRRDPRHLAKHPEGSREQQRLRDALASPSVYQSFLQFLAANGCEIPAEHLDAAPATTPPEDARVRAVLVDVYRHRPELAQVCERLVDLDEGLQEWRYRHVKMVERTIGGKPGTGGSMGAAYLRTTLFQALFPDLWSIRSEF